MNKTVPQMFNDKLSIGTCSMRKHLGYPLKLTYTTVFFALSGQASVQINFKTQPFKSPDILVLSDDFIVTITSTTEDFELFYCLINRDFATEIAYLLPNTLFTQLHYFPLCPVKPIDIPILKMWLGQLEHLHEKGTLYRYLLLKNHLQNLFLILAENTTPNTGSERQKFSRKELLCWKFWDLISIHSKQHRDVAFYAQQLCISPFYLSQIAKKFLNYSPKALINRQVILEIKALLSTTELPIKIIAEQLHFEDTSYLSRYFKQQTGLTLLEFRKK